MALTAALQFGPHQYEAQQYWQSSRAIGDQIVFLNLSERQSSGIWPMTDTDMTVIKSGSGGADWFRWRPCWSSSLSVATSCRAVGFQTVMQTSAFTSIHLQPNNLDFS